MRQASAKKTTAQRQLAFWQRHWLEIDAERDRGWTGTFLRQRAEQGQALQPWSIRGLVSFEFRSEAAYDMAGHLMLCLALREGPPCFVLSYRDWGAVLGCCERTAGSAARELAMAGWAEIRPHFVPYTTESGRVCHAQMISSFAPGPLMRLAWQVYERLRAAADLPTAPVVHSPRLSVGDASLPAKRDPSIFSQRSDLTFSYAGARSPQAPRGARHPSHRRILEPQRGRVPGAPLATHRPATPQTGAAGAGAVKGGLLNPKELQAALSEAYRVLEAVSTAPAPARPYEPSEVPARNVHAFRRFIDARIRRECAAREAVQLSLARLAESAGVSLAPRVPGPPSPELQAFCPPACVCSLCFGARARA